MSGRGFESAFAAELDAYLAFKHDMGIRGESRTWYLRQFDNYCHRRHLAVFDRDTVEGWVTAQLERSATARSWMSYIRDFGRWLRVNGATDAYVLSDRWKAPLIPPHPYLLTRREIDAFFTAAAALDVRSPWRWQAAAFFTLMHSCGLRTCETRGLATGDVNLPGGYIDIVWSKGNRGRRLPVTGDVVDVLAACDDTSRAQFPSRGTFFVSGTGKQVSRGAVGNMFRRIWGQAGLARPTAGLQPRPYDFRHHFAYGCIERWMAQGADVAAMLPYLSRYMGHAAFAATFYYIHTSPDFMNGYARITEQGTWVLPEVGFE